MLKQMCLLGQISPTASINYCTGNSRRLLSAESIQKFIQKKEATFSLSYFLCTHLKDRMNLTGSRGGYLQLQHSTSNGPSGRLSNHSFAETSSLARLHPTHLVHHGGRSSHIYTHTHTHLGSSPSGAAWCRHRRTCRSWLI